MSGVESYRTKVAVIRDPSVPPGQPAPMWLNCPCGAKPATRYQGPDVTCACGKVYSHNGHLVGVPGYESPFGPKVGPLSPQPKGGKRRHGSRDGWSEVGGGIWMLGTTACAVYVAGSRGDWTIEAHRNGVKVQSARGVAKFEKAQDIGETFYALMCKRPAGGKRRHARPAKRRSSSASLGAVMRATRMLRGLR